MGNNNHQDDNDIDMMKDMSKEKLEELQRQLPEEDKDESTS